MKELRNKILRAINKGLNEALDLDDFSEDDLKILKKSLGTIIKDSNYRNSKGYYQDLMNEIMNNFPNIIGRDILKCSDLYKLLGVKYNPLLDGKDFKTFILTIIEKSYTKNLNLNWIDTSEVTDMSEVFCNTINPYIMTIHMEDWDVSNVKYMYATFAYSGINGDISKWDVSNVVTMQSMFWNFRLSYKNISKWNVSNVKNMDSMFRNSSFNSYINNWDVSNVTSMYCMFKDSIFNQSLSKWKLNDKVDLSHMFEYAHFNRNITKWKINDKNTYKMFDHCMIEEGNKPLQ